MEQESRTRIAVAAPIALLAAIAGMAVAAALSRFTQWPILAVAALLPSALSVWCSQGAGAASRVLLVIATLMVSLGVAAAVTYLLVPLFEVDGVGLSAAGVHALLWGPTGIVLIGSLVARARSGAPLLGTWLLWWIAVAAGVTWAEPLTYALTDLTGADAMAGTIAVLAVPTLGMSAWVGTVGVLFLYMRSRRGPLPSGTTGTPGALQ